MVARAGEDGAGGKDGAGEDFGEESGARPQRIEEDEMKPLSAGFISVSLSGKQRQHGVTMVKRWCSLSSSFQSNC